MKKIFTFLAMSIILLTTNLNLKGQCSFISPTVEINTIQTNVGGNCEITMKLSFDIITNSGNKIIFLHLWEQSDYPSLNYGCNQCQPSAANLVNAIANFVIDNNNAVPVFLTSYGPANSVSVKTPVNNPGLTIVKSSSTTPGADKLTISGLKVVLPGTCSSTFSFQGDAWSSNANSNNPVVHCAMAGFVVGASDPTLTVTRSCVAYSLNVTTVATTRDIYYDVFMDDGDGIFEGLSGATPDILINSVTVGSAITITPTSPYNSGTIPLAPPYNSTPYTTRKMYVALSVVGVSFIGLTSVAPVSCGTTPIIISDFYAQRKNGSTVTLNWKTSTEINAKGFEIERKTDNGFTKVAFVNASNKPSGSSYSYQDYNSSKSLSQYRIKMVDLDGSFKLSEIKSVKGNSATSDFTIYPNPSKGSTQISISDIAEPTDVQLIDQSGRILRTVSLSNSNVVNLNNLQKGIYLVRVINKSTGGVVTKKLNVVQ